jgi:phosphoglycerate kinase
MEISKITDLDLVGKRVLVRADLDVGESLDGGDNNKLLTNKNTIEYLKKKDARIVLMSHRGRPGGVVNRELSMAPVAERLSELLGVRIKTTNDIVGTEAHSGVNNLVEGEILVLENLRFDGREEENTQSFAKSLSELGDVYINEAFSSSAKPHASVVGVPKFLPHGLGFHFLEEIENLGRVLKDPKRPVVVIISGVKKDKLDYVEPFSKFADKVLIAGRLPEIIDPRGIGKSELEPEFRDKILDLIAKGKVIVADLVQDKEDITIHSIERFEAEVKKAGTIMIGGPIGKFEDEGHRQGTRRVFEAVAGSDAFKVAGGGDTEQAVQTLGLTDKFDWVSVGGGASLEFLAKGTLPGIEMCGR